MGAGRRIGEVARRTGVTVRTLRHYDAIGLVVPSARSAGDHRLYTPQDVRRLLVVLRLKALGLGLDEVRAALDDPGFDAAAAFAAHLAAAEEQLVVLRTLHARLSELQAAADVGWEEVLAVAHLTEQLRHPEPAVRVRAALDGAQAAPLGALLDQLVQEHDDGVVGTLVWAVTRHGADAVDPVRGRAADPDPRVRHRMVTVLAKLADRRAVPTLVAALDDPDPRTAATAVFALGQVADPAGLPPLVARLGGRDADAVGDAVTRFGAAAVPQLAAVLATGATSARCHAAEVLGGLDDVSAVAPLVAALDDGSADVRSTAVLALGRLPGADEALATATTHADAHVAAVARHLTAGRAARSR